MPPQSPPPLPPESALSLFPGLVQAFAPAPRRFPLPLAPMALRVPEEFPLPALQRYKKTFQKLSCSKFGLRARTARLSSAALRFPAHSEKIGTADIPFPEIRRRESKRAAMPLRLPDTIAPQTAPSAK